MHSTPPGIAWGSARAGLVGACLLLATVGCGALPPASAPAEVVRASEPFEVRLWRAGRVISPALPAARRTELEAERARALAELGAELQRAEEARLVARLRAQDTPDELWAAAARVLAELERYDLARELVPALAPSAPPARSVAARSALHRLYGHWFAQPDEVEPYLASVRAGEGTRLLRESAAREEERSRTRLFEALAHDPRAAASWLGDPDPRVRSGAARLVAREFTRADGAGEARLIELLARLEHEHEAEAFHEELAALLAPLERADAGSVAARRLRSLLVELLDGAVDARGPSLAAGVARLTWSTDGPRDDQHLLTVVAALGTRLEELVARDRERGAGDPDALVAVLDALHELGAEASAAGLQAELRAGPARAGVLAVLLDAGQEESVRSVAAATFGGLARAEDTELFARLLADDGPPVAVRHALLGALRELLPELAGNAPARARALDALARCIGASDPDLRRKALGLCLEPAFAAELGAFDPGFLVARLGAENDAANARELLRLLARLARPADLGGLLSLPSFAALAGDPATLTELVAVLERTVAGAPRDAMRAATRLANEGGDETRLARLRQALGLVARLDDLSAIDLEPRDHRAVCAWVWRLAEAGIPPREATSRGSAFAQRVLEVHLVRGERDPGAAGESLAPAERAHLAARLAADLFLAGVGQGTKAQVETAFEAALALAPAGQPGFVVLRDRARFRAAASERLRALADYRRLLESGPEAEALLGIPDLRAAIELLGRLDEAGLPGASSSAGEAFELLERLVAREAWRAEPAAVRMQDLRAWVQAGLDARDAQRLLRLETALAELPLTQVEVPTPTGPAPLWFGLTRESAWFQELLDLRSRVRLALREREARG